MKEFDLVVIGAGPAGIAAATAAGRFGAAVALIDENRYAGGKVFHRIRQGTKKGFSDELEKRVGTRLLKGLRGVEDRVSVYMNAEVWYFNDRKTVSLYPKETASKQTDHIKGRKLIMAAGAFERVIPFPGWTLPGVFTIGGLNRLVTGGVLPGKRYLIAGSGPLQLVLAYHLINAGGRIAAIVDAASFRETAASTFQSIQSIGMSRLRSGFEYMRAIKRHHIPILRSHAVCKASGTCEVETVEIVRIDNAWRPINGSQRVLAVDAVACGYGLMPSTTLTRLCGCRHAYDERLGYWRAVHNNRFETTVPGVFVVGDGRTIKGYSAAIEEAKIAAVEAGTQLGYIDPPQAERVMRPCLRRLKRFKRLGRIMDALSAPRPGIWEILSDETVVCRCEEITLRDIASAVKNGAAGVNDIKRRTRLGMGHCQGRLCGQVINELLWKLTGIRQNREVFTPRIPAKPVPFACLAG